MFYISLLILCMSFFSDRNVAVEGKAFQNNIYHLFKKKIPAAIDGNHARKYYDRACPTSYMSKTSWFRVEFLRLVEVFAIKILPGKFGRYSMDGGLSHVNKECH